MWIGGELGIFKSGNLLTPVSDPKVIRWHTTSFSYVGDLIDLDFFGLQRRRFRDIGLILLLTYASSLKLLGYIPEATAIYRSLARRRGRLGAYGWLGLGDIQHTIALWNRLVDAYDSRNLTLFPLVNGLNAFLSEEMGWTIAADATFCQARACYTRAINAAPDLAFAWHELARLEADDGNYAAAAAAMTAFARRSGEGTKGGSRLVGELEAARLRALAAAPQIDPDDAARLQSWHEGPIRVVSSAPRDDAAVSGDADVGPRELHASLTAYWRGRAHLVEKRLVFEKLESHLVPRGFISAYAGAPFVTSRGETCAAATSYPFFPGREIFSPLFLGKAGDHELYVARTTSAIRNAVVLPGFADNYFHFLFDTVGALALVEPDLRHGRQFVMFTQGLKRFHRDVFEAIGLRAEQVKTLRPGRYAVEAENVVVVDYPTPLAVVHPQTLPFLRDSLVGGTGEITPRKRIYLARAGTRSFDRDSQVQVRELLSRYGFTEVHAELLSVPEQIELLRDAEVVAVDGGAGAANLLFAPPGAKVILLASLIGYTDAWTPLCAAGGLDLHVVLSDARVHPKYLLTWSELHPRADAKTLEICLETALAPLDAAHRRER
jgi:hypothetical protein